MSNLINEGHQVRRGNRWDYIPNNRGYPDLFFIDVDNINLDLFTRNVRIRPDQEFDPVNYILNNMNLPFEHPLRSSALYGRLDNLLGDSNMEDSNV